jgi:hypothetical protein
MLVVFPFLSSFDIERFNAAFILENGSKSPIDNGPLANYEETEISQTIYFSFLLFLSCRLTGSFPPFFLENGSMLVTIKTVNI